MKYKNLLEHQIHPDTRFGENVRLGFGVVIEEGCEIGDNTLICHYCILRANTKIGCDCKIGHHVIFEGNCRIGNKISIHPFSIITIRAVVEDSVFIGPGFVGLNDKKMSYLRDEKWIPNSYRIKRGARVGASVTVLPGLEIGENSAIGAGSLITKNVPPNTIVCGSPAKIIKSVPEEEII